jgi:16S rRNA (uracil1498-N3)-methyltransferase
VRNHSHNLFYIARSDINGDEFVVKGEQFHHLIHVMRKGLNDRVMFTDGQANRIDTIITKIDRTRAWFHIFSTKLVDREPGLMLDLAYAPVKGARNELVFEKCTELGVHKYRLFHSKHSIVRQPGRAKCERFRKIIMGAMLQSVRFYLPGLEVHNNMYDLIAQFDEYDRIVLADMEGEKDVPGNAQHVLFIVGPEGGIHDAEKSLLIQAGAQLLSIGNTRLRSETAAIAGITKILTAYTQL